MKNWLYADITSDILKAYFAVYNTLKHRRAYSEENFAQALIFELVKKSRQAKAQVAVQRHYEDKRIGTDLVDVVVDDKVVIEIKRVAALKEIHLDQIKTYLLDGHWAVGLVLNFGGDEPEFRRIENRSAPAYLQHLTQRG